MQVKLMEPNAGVADFAISGSTIVIGALSIDCAARQQDAQVLIEIRDGGAGVVEGGDSGAYVAQIIIPARRYDSVIDPDGGEDGTPAESQVPVPLDPAAVQVVLWPTV